MSIDPADPPDVRPPDAGGAGGGTTLDAQISRFVDGVRFVERRLRNATMIGAVAGGIDAVLAFVIDWRAGIAVAVLVLLVVLVQSIYRRRLTGLIRAEPDIRADMRQNTLTTEQRERVVRALRDFESGPIQGRLGAARGIGDALKDHPMATRAASIKGTFVHPTLQLTLWTFPLVGLFIVAIVPLAIVAIIVAIA